MPRYALGIDIGGTFTDLVVYDHERGRQLNRKVLTTHDDPSRAVAAGVAALLEAGGVEPVHVARVVHATTGPVLALLATAGDRERHLHPAPGYVQPSVIKPGQVIVLIGESDRRRTGKQRVDVVIRVVGVGAARARASPPRRYPDEAGEGGLPQTDPVIA